MFLIFVIYLLATWYIGHIVIEQSHSKLPSLFHCVGSFLIGTVLVIPGTYFLSWLLIPIGLSAYWVVSIITVVCIGIGIRYKEPLKLSFSVSDIGIGIFSLLFSIWLMQKTLHGDSTGQVFVGSNNIFDFGLALGLIRSGSWGANIPFMSPFFSGAPLFYHYFFVYWVSLWEYFGLPLVWAMNIPSILSFTSLLIIVYSFPQIVLKQHKLTGWIAVLLTITHSTSTWWRYLLTNGISIETGKKIWGLSIYPFAGPYDGSTVSIFMTLNNYVNQRHLAFSIAAGLAIIILIFKSSEQQKMGRFFYVCCGILTGLLFLWNMPICAIVGVVIAMVFILYKQWRPLGFFFLGSGIGVIVLCVQYIPFYIQTLTVATRLFSGTFGSISQILPIWTLGQYLGENLTILPLITVLGFVIIPNKNKRFVFPFLGLFIIECLLSGLGKRGFDQKFLSFLIIGVNIVAAVGITALWHTKKVLWRVTAIISMALVMFSGFIDIMVIKNEFAYPLISAENKSVISWIAQNTPKTAVFVSYSDMIDPVVLAGRKNYFGFFGNIGWKDRSPEVKNMYSGDMNVAKQLGISYILVPKWSKNDFPYVVDTKYFTEHQTMVYEDERYSIYSTMLK